MTSSTTTLIAALRILAVDIQSGDGVANAAIAEAADRLEELSDASQGLLDAVHANCDFLPHDTSAVYRAVKELERILKNEQH